MSGTTEGIDLLCSELKSMSMITRASLLPVSAPFHSRFMIPASDIFFASLQKIALKEPKVTFVSNVTASPILSALDIPCLLTRQMSSTVLWHQSIVYCRSKGVRNWIVLGPGRVQSNLLKRDFPTDNIMSHDFNFRTLDEN